MGSSIAAPLDVGPGGSGVQTGQTGLGFNLSWMSSFSKNGDNTYLTNTMKGRYDGPAGLFCGISIPFLYIEARKETAMYIHEYTVMNVGDAIVRIGADLREALNKIAGGKAPPPGAERNGKAIPATGKDPVHVILDVSLVMPTGKNTSSYRDPGTLLEVYFPPEAQMGQGIWKPGIGLTAYRRFARFYPLAVASYSYGRMLSPSDYLLSDSLTLGAGSLFMAWPEIDLRFTAMLMGVFNVHDIRNRDPFSGRWETSWDSHGWLFFLSLDTSVAVWKGLFLDLGAVIPLGKTLEESPNDLDYLVKAGARFRF